MADLRISEMTAGGPLEETDEIPAARAGDNVKVSLGTMASEDAADYLTEDEVTEEVRHAPDIVVATGDLTLTDADHNGVEIVLRNTSASPQTYSINVPYNLPVGFRCSFLYRTQHGVTIRPATGSPNDTLNGINGATAVFPTPAVNGLCLSAYLRKVAVGELVITGAISVS